MSGHIGDTVAVDWGTPPHIVERVKAVFGGTIDLDPCWNEHSVVGPTFAYALPYHDGLAEPWLTSPIGTAIHSVYVNPPYGRTYLDLRTKTPVSKDEYKRLPKEFKKAIRSSTIYDWIKVCSQTGTQPDVEVIALIPAATDTAHWHDIVFPTAKAICFVKGRLVFLLPNDGRQKVQGAPAPNASAIVYWGDYPGTFEDIFSVIGKVKR